jgi:hypothetical protein
MLAIGLPEHLWGPLNGVFIPTIRSTVLRKLLLSPWFGPLPPWIRLYRDNVEVRLKAKGYDVAVPGDLADFARRVETNLGIKCAVTEGSGKVHDYRPALALIYPELVEGYDFWGHTDLDCVYGRVGEFWPDDFLSEVDVASDHWDYVCGPFTLYRNTERLNRLFMDAIDWRGRLEQPAVSGWVETDYTRMLGDSGLRVAYRLSHGYRNPDACHWDGDKLMEGQLERSFFHFRWTKEWPKGLA